jgi:membrane protease YdiL (CAAX protease family)
MPRWTVGDFVWVFVGGIFGSLLAATSVLFTTSLGEVLAVTLLGQQAGHVVALVLVVKRRGASMGDLGFDVRPSDGVFVFFGVFLQFAVQFAFLPLARLLNIDESPQTLTEVIPTVEGLALKTLLMVSLALVAPVLEEIMFRGILYKVVDQRWGPGAAIWVTSLVFSLFHLVGVGGSDPLLAAALVIPLFFVVGLVLALQRRRHDRLGPPIFTHAGFNLVSALILLFAPDLAGL